MQDPPRYDVAVIGAGIAGASAAYWLARAGARVALIEAGHPATGASGASFAWLNAAHKEPDAYHRLNAAGMAEYDSLERDVEGIEVHRTGSLHWPVTPGEEARLAERGERLERLGYPARWISRAECLEREPGLRLPPAAERVLWLERDAWLDPPTVIRALLAAARHAVRLHEAAEVTGFTWSEDELTGVRTADREFAADTFLICAGTATGELAELLDAVVPVERSPGLLLVTEPLPGALHHVAYHGLGRDHDIHLRPDVGGGLRIGSNATDRQLSAATTREEAARVAEELLARATSVLPALEGVSVERVHLGVRPVPVDGLTVAGRLPGLDNAYVAVTHSGITLGPLLGRLLAAEITGDDPSPLLLDFRPERFVAARN
jgi:glycine/D-amino acid oxidase-like deaminating enzyme